MKKTVLLVIVASFLLTSCNLIDLINRDNNESTDTYSEDYSEPSKNSTEKVSKYDAYTDCDWYGIGLEKYTDHDLDLNSYYEYLIKYETMKKGKYLSNDTFNGHYNLFICANGDVAMDDLDHIKFFHKSEYSYVTTQFSDRSYIPQELGLTAAEQKYDFYFELACTFAGVSESSLSYNDTVFSSINDVYSFYGIQLKNKISGSVEADDETCYVCSDAFGKGPSYDEGYVFTTYMNCNPAFKFVGLPPFLSSSDITSWSYERKYTNMRGMRHWSDSVLNIYLDGYTPEDAKTWYLLLTAAGYQKTKLQDNLDSESSPSFSYEGTINILGYVSSAANSATHYLKNKIALNLYTMKHDENNNPIEFSVQFRIEFAKTTVWDTCGTFVFQDDGLYMYYSDSGVQQKDKIVNENKEIETESIFKNNTTFSFFFVHELMDID